MRRAIDLDAILAPVPGDNPAGEDLRYSSIYDEIKEARRADDALDRGDWKHEIKTSDWDKVITTAVEALSKKSKDLQIAAWLAEALTNTEGFNGLATGFKILTGFLGDYWDHLYPMIEEGDLEFRIAPIEFLNERLGESIKEASLTDGSLTPGYSWFKWQESRGVGYEADTRNRYGDMDENKKSARDEKIAEGKLSAEDFDSAVALSSKAWFVSLAESLTRCQEELKALDEKIDEKFGQNAPSLAEIRKALEDCERVITKILKEKKGREPAPEKEAEPSPEPEPKQKGKFLSKFFKKEHVAREKPDLQADKSLALQTEEVSERKEAGPPLTVPGEGRSPMADFSFQIVQPSDSDSLEKVIWEKSLEMLETSGMQEALGQLLGASYSAPSVRQRNRYRLLMAKLCLMAGRPDLARPIVEELHVLIEELHLERWESPLWIAELLGTFYQCLMSGEPSDEDAQKANLLFKRICTTDITKAMIYKE